MLTFTFVKDYYLDEKPPFVHAGFTNMNGVTYEFFQNYFTGTEPMGNCTVIRPKYQTQRHALSKTIDFV
jgi:hypothetical protein